MLCYCYSTREKSENVKVARFMTVIGPETIAIYNSFNVNDADKINLQIVKNRFRDFFVPKVNISFERYIYILFKIEQNEDE